MDITKDVVRLAYQLFLNREGSESEVANMAGNHTSIRTLRGVFLNSGEFNTKLNPLPTSKDRQGKVPPTLIHLHIPKTAGSSLTKLIALNPSHGTKLTANDNQIANLPIQKRRAMGFLFGHLSHGVARHLPQDHLYICVLREPGPRLLSFYQYLYRTESHPHQKIVGGQNMSFGTFLEWVAQTDSRGEVDNGQVRRLAGLGMSERYGEEADLLPIALSHIFAPDMIYGLTEHFDHFVDRLRAQGIIAEKTALRENAAPHLTSLEAAVAELTKEQKALYESFIYWDTIFYNICRDVYLATTEREEPVSGQHIKHG